MHNCVDFVVNTNKVQGCSNSFKRSVAPSLSERKALVGRREVARLTRFEAEAVMVMVSDSDSNVDQPALRRQQISAC